jgi:hypothetical protein
VAEAQSAVGNTLNRWISSELCTKTGVSGEINDKRGEILGFGMYHFMGGENAQINS